MKHYQGPTYDPAFDTATADNLFAAEGVVLTEEVTLAAGTLTRGAVLGKRTKDTVGACTPDAGNTGDGAPGAVTLGAKAEVGTYLLRCITAAGNGGVFAVFAPSGARLDDLTVAVAYTGDHINLTIADGAADFIVGDKFTIEIAGTSEYVLAAAAAVDGSAHAGRILAQDADASGGAVTALVYKTGIFNERALSFGVGHSVATVREDLEAVGIYLKDSVAK